MGNGPDKSRMGDIPGVETVHAGSADYDTARTVWNAMVDERPAAIARCRNADDVTRSVNAARAAGRAISVKGGGHNIAGTAVGSGAVMIDLSAMRSVRIDPGRRIARVEGGATLADLDRAAQVHGLATPAGVVSDTGIGGLTLGGGFGWLSRRHGLTVDNLVSVDMVLADGAQRRASAGELPDLFWALRGGSGNFGVATAFEFHLHPVGPDVLFGPTFFALDHGHEALRFWADFMATAPRACTVWADLATAPPAPFLPETCHGKPVVILMAFWAGEPEEGEAILAPLRNHRAALGNAVAWRPYGEAQAFLDQTYARGARNYWSAVNHRTMDDPLIAHLIDLAAHLPSPESDILLCAHGGAIDDIAPMDTAYPHRNVPFMVTPGARWRDPAEDTEMIAWVRQAAGLLRAGASPGAYVNFIADRDGQSEDAYGPNGDRLAAIKQHYDPENLFRINQNILPHPASNPVQTGVTERSGLSVG